MTTGEGNYFVGWSGSVTLELGALLCRGDPLWSPESWASAGACPSINKMLGSN